MRALRTTALALAGAAGLLGCGTTDVTQARVQRAVGQSFGRLYVAQQALLGRPGLSAATVAALASCHRGPGAAARGPGDDWTCDLLWRNASGQDAAASYEVAVRADGCYTATGAPAVIGPQQLERVGGALVRNPLASFDGCFDTSCAGLAARGAQRGTRP